jgi:hypothetical protein
MTARVRVRDSGGTLRTLTRIRVRDSGGTLRTLTRIRVRDAGNVLRVVYDTTGASSFAATADHGTRSGSGNGTATTNTVIVTPTGGTAPYHHAWTLISHSNATNPTINSPSSGTTTFTQTNLGAGEADTATFRDTVTDSATPANSTTVDVIANFFDTSTV